MLLGQVFERFCARGNFLSWFADFGESSVLQTLDEMLKVVPKPSTLEDFILIVDLMSLVSVAFVHHVRLIKASAEIGVSMTSIYNKLNGIRQTSVLKER